MSSILFPSDEERVLGAPSETTADLHLDQMFDKVIAPRTEYELGPVFYTPLRDAAEVRFRQAIFHDIDAAGLRPGIDEFAGGMRSTRRMLTGLTKLHSRRQQQAWFLDAVDLYCTTVAHLAEQLQPAAAIQSTGLRQVIEHLDSLTRSGAYRRLCRDTTETLDKLHAIRYRLTVLGNRVIIEAYEGETDYSQQVLATFERFRQRDLPPSATPRRLGNYMNHIDAAVLDRVARLRPAEFAALDAFCETHRDFIDPALARFERELQFYTAVADLLAPLRSAGLPVCFPEVADDDPTIDAHDVFDLALADKLVAESRPVVLNDLTLTNDERIVVITGPNQGGKTTFARLFGQLHHLAALGAPVPGSRVRLGLFDRIFTHFERTEDLRTLSGKLEDELVRIRAVIEEATDRSIVVMNESFGSTSLHDARLLGTATINKLIDIGLRAIYVTFVDELSGLGPSIVSMVSTVAPDDPNVRTFKVVRHPADGRAYAMCIAERHGLTARQLKERIGA